jgi:pilus assembly protein CpaC
MRVLTKPLWLPIAVALATAAAITTPVATSAQRVSTQAFPIVDVNTSRGRMVTMDAPISDVFVADPAIADVQVRSERQIYIFGKAPGETTVSATTKGGRVVYAATVRVGNNYSTIPQMLKLAMPDSQITATPMNGLVMLTGTVAQPDDAAEAERLVKAFVGEKIQVLSRLRTSTPLQVNLQVKIAEVSRSFIKNIGVNLQTRDMTNGFQLNVASGRPVGSIGPADVSNFPILDASGQFGLPANSIRLPFNPRTGSFVYPGTGTKFDFSELANGTERTALGLATKIAGLDLLSAIDLGETIGQVTTLAQPNLTALSGETASFLAGGEVPVPIAQALGSIAIEFKQYGVSLAYTPTVLADGRISLRVRPEVSELSAAGAITLGGNRIPAFTTRRAETTVEIGSGQSFMIAGLLNNVHSNQIDKAPGLGDVPVLGALFRSNGWRRNETELVVVVTPYLVKPVNASEIVLPTDGYKSPSDVERVLLGTLSSGQSGVDRPKPAMATPSAPMPTVGAVTPATPLPSPAAPVVRREEKAVAPKKSKKDAAATPGFSFN